MLLERFFGGPTNNNEQCEREAADFAAHAHTLADALALQQEAWEELYAVAKSGNTNDGVFSRAVDKKEAIDRKVRELMDAEDESNSQERKAA